MRNEDPRCCGTGTCMINDEGVCWCGQRWDGEAMCPPHGLPQTPTGQPRAAVQQSLPGDNNDRADNAHG